MASFLDVCRFNPTLGGTTDWTYSSAVQGYNTPALANAVTATQYSIRAESADLSQWEVSQGNCTITGGVATFARTTVLYNSSGTGTLQSGVGTKTNFTAAPQVAIVALAEDLLPTAVVAPSSASLGADVAMTTAATYFDGPAISQGSVGTWFVSGTVTVVDPIASRNVNCKLWDGATVIASATVSTAGAGFSDTITLSGFITAPAGNLRMSCAAPTSTTAKIQFNQSGNSKDSTITAYRIK